MERHLRTELEFFRKMEPKLIRDGHLGNFVVIHDHEILAMGKDIDEALDNLLRKHRAAPEPLLIRQILGERGKPVSIRSPRSASNSALKVKVRWLSVRSPNNSVCSSARLADLDFREWWTDTSFDRFYLHVRHIKSGDGLDMTVHRVYCKHADRPRLGMKSGQIHWIVD